MFRNKWKEKQTAVVVAYFKVQTLPWLLYEGCKEKDLKDPTPRSSQKCVLWSQVYLNDETRSSLAEFCDVSSSLF